uniref:Uncharacterized protein n=1 Tax=Amphora coffeiformis TaxID=265554 RepID=A0A7S3LEK6_9STRA
MELPSIRIKPKEENEESIHRISPPEPTRQAQSPPEVTAAAPNAAAAQPSTTSKLNSLLPPEFLANMPPHIAAIAHSKPDLVRKILASKQQPALLSDAMSPMLYGKMPAVPEQQDDEEDEEYTTSGDEGERTELLRQRRKKAPPQAYNSIWNG